MGSSIISSKKRKLPFALLLVCCQPLPLLVATTPIILSLAPTPETNEQVTPDTTPGSGKGESTDHTTMRKESSTIIQAGETLATLNDWRAILFASLFISFCLIGGLFTTLGLFLRTSSRQAEAAAALSTSLMALTASLSELKASHTSVLEALGRIEGQNMKKR